MWAALWDVGSWPRWWRDVAEARTLRPGDESGGGRRALLVFRSPLGYRLAFETEIVHAERPRCFRAVVSGQLRGTGTWTLTPSGDGVVAVITWVVEVRSRWMRALSPAAAPAFRWAHRRVMRRGERSLVRYLARR